MKRLWIIAINLMIISGAQSVLAQSTGNSDTFRPGGPGTPTVREIQERDFENRRRALEQLKQMKPEPRVEKTKELTKEEKKRFKEVITPDEEDLIKYENFLKQSKTGIFRLLPDFDCEPKNLIRVDGDCANFVPGTWAYSFRQKDYSNADFHDINFKDNFLISNGFLTQGILVSLGDVPLENVSLTSDGMKYLIDFQPETTRQTALEQSKQIRNSIKSDNYIYSNKAKVEANMTYAMRLVAYRYKDKFKVFAAK